MYPETCNPAKNHPAYRYGRTLFEDAFRCRQCNMLVTMQSMLSGVKNRNHCPYCLWSRHVDLYEAGDRLSACRSPMEPIGLTVKQRQNKYGIGNTGELMLIHHCEVCDKFSINRIAADDISDKLLEVFHASVELDATTRGNWKYVESRCYREMIIRCDASVVGISGIEKRRGLRRVFQKNHRLLLIRAAVLHPHPASGSRQNQT